MQRKAKIAFIKSWCVGNCAKPGMRFGEIGKELSRLLTRKLIIYCELSTWNCRSTIQPFEGTIAQKRPTLANRRKIMFHQNNARPQTCGTPKAQGELG